MTSNKTNCCKLCVPGGSDGCLTCPCHVKEPDMKTRPAWIKGMEKKTGKSFTEPEQIPGHGYCTKCGLEVQPIMECKCEFRTIKEPEPKECPHQDLFPKNRCIRCWQEENLSPKECHKIEIQDSGICKNCGTNHTITTASPKESWEEDLKQTIIHLETIVEATHWTEEEKQGIKKFIELIESGEYLHEVFRRVLSEAKEEGIKFGSQVRSDILIEKAQAQTLTEIKEKIGKEKVDENFNSGWHKENAKGYNEAIDDILNLLDSNK